MKLRVWLLLGLAFVLSTACAQASSLPPDPAITIVGGTGSTIEGLNFSLTFPADFFTCSLSNSITFDSCFEGLNGSNQTWFSILVNFPTQSGAVTCDPGVFLSCQVFGNSILFSGGPGIVDHFKIAITGWASGTTFGFQANPIPEPGTLGLLGTGLGALLTGRLWRKRRNSQQTG